MKYTLTLCLSIATSVTLFGQTAIGRFKLKNNEIITGTYTRYQPPILLKPTYKDTSEASNNSPEALMTAVLSANSKVWEKYNSTDYDDTQSYEEIDNTNLTFELTSKYEFKQDTTAMVIVKFKLINATKAKVVLGVTVMQKNKQRWKTTSSAFANRLSMLFLVFKDDVLSRMILQRPQNGEEAALLKKALEGNVLNLETLLNQTFTARQKSYFINPLNW